MAMLERRGIIRKAETEDEPAQAETAAERSRPEADIRTLFGQPDGDAPAVTPASRQPVPGIMSPVLPAEKPSDAERVEPRPIERVVALQQTSVERTKPDIPLPGEPDKPAPVEPKPFEIERPKPPEPMPTEIERPKPIESKPAEIERPKPIEIERPKPIEVQIPAPHYVEVDPFKVIAPTVDEDEDEDEAEFETFEMPSFERPPPPPPVENYTERYLEIDELYEALALKTKRTDTVYLIEEYIKTLPDSLPDESRREIVGKIITASGFDYDILMGDGVLRVKMLKEYAERFARHTDDYVSARQAELDELDQQSLRIRRLIENRRELHKKQFFAIEAEAQRLKEILTFISG